MAETQRFYSIEELGQQPPPVWLIENIMEANTLVMVAGPPGSYKSFLCLDWLLCMAAGMNWNGKRTLPSRVLYVLGEGRASLLKRIETWIHFRQPSEAQRTSLKANFKVTFEVPQMVSKMSVDNMLAQLSDDNYAPTVIAIDTFARSFVGMDENSSKDTGMWVEQADRLRSLGYTVIFLHHTTKNVEFGPRYRGSTAIMGAMDTAMMFMRDGVGGHKNRVKLEITKQKDHDEGEPLRFQALVVTPPGSDEGSIILTPIANMDERFSEEAQSMLSMIDDLIADTSFESDRARARELVRHFDIGEEAANKKIMRRRRVAVPDVDMVEMTIS